MQVPFDANHTPTIHDVCFPRIHGKGMNHVRTLQHVTLWGCQGTLLYSLSKEVVQMALPRNVEHNPLCHCPQHSVSELVISFAGLVIM